MQCTTQNGSTKKKWASAHLLVILSQMKATLAKRYGEETLLGCGL
jgi:hypothetical protein